MTDSPSRGHIDDPSNGWKKHYTTIPFDDNENKVADCGWMAENAEIHENTLGDVKSDIDNDPIPGITGDGYLTFEEYRGFKVRNIHRRTNPFKKDLFIYSEIEPQGIGYVYPETELTVHRIWDGEYNSTNNEVNTNRNGISTDPQCTLVISDCGYFAPYQLGYSFRRTGPEESGKPCEFIEGCVYIEGIRERTPPNHNIDDVDAPDDGAIRWVISHESGHMIDINHYSWNPGSAIWDIMVDYPDSSADYPDFEQKAFIDDPPTTYDDFSILQIRLK